MNEKNELLLLGEDYTTMRDISTLSHLAYSVFCK